MAVDRRPSHHLAHRFGITGTGVGAPVLLADIARSPDATGAEVTSCADQPVTLTRIGGPELISDRVLAALDAADATPCG